MSVNGNSLKLGDCLRCLLPTPTPWYVSVLDKLEADMRTNDVPQEYWLYLISANGRYETHNVAGLAEKRVGHANAWYFKSRADVEAEFQVHQRAEAPPCIYVVDARNVTPAPFQ
jgi:hypothetical protein